MLYVIILLAVIIAIGIKSEDFGFIIICGFTLLLAGSFVVMTILEEFPFDTYNGFVGTYELIPIY